MNLVEMKNSHQLREYATWIPVLLPTPQGGYAFGVVRFETENIPSRVRIRLNPQTFSFGPDSHTTKQQQILLAQRVLELGAPMEWENLFRTISCGIFAPGNGGDQAATINLVLRAITNEGEQSERIPLSLPVSEQGGDHGVVGGYHHASTAFKSLYEKLWVNNGGIIPPFEQLLSPEQFIQLRPQILQEAQIDQRSATSSEHPLVTQAFVRSLHQVVRVTSKDQRKDLQVGASEITRGATSLEKLYTQALSFIQYVKKENIS